jgi:hypothetical protein
MALICIFLYVGKFISQDRGIYNCMIGIFTFPLFGSVIGRRHDWMLVWHVDQVGPDGREKSKVEFDLFESDLV